MALIFHLLLHLHLFVLFYFCNLFVCGMWSFICPLFVRMSRTVVQCSSYEVKLLTRFWWERLHNVGFLWLCSKVRPSRSWGLDWRLSHSVKILSAHLQQIHTLRFCKWQKMAIETKIHRTMVQSISHPFSSNLRTCSCSTVTIWRINCNPANLLQLWHYQRFFAFAHIWLCYIWFELSMLLQKKELCPPLSSTDLFEICAVVELFGCMLLFHIWYMCKSI